MIAFVVAKNQLAWGGAEVTKKVVDLFESEGIVVPKILIERFHQHYWFVMLGTTPDLDLILQLKFSNIHERLRKLYHGKYWVPTKCDNGYWEVNVGSDYDNPNNVILYQTSYSRQKMIDRLGYEKGSEDERSEDENNYI